MTALPSRADITDALADGPTMAPRFGDLRDFVAQLIGGAAETELTVAAGVITPTGFQHRVDTEGEAASDNLDQIAYTNLPDGSLVMLTAENAARVNTLRHLNGTATPGTNGEMVLDNAANFALDAADKWIVLRRKGTQWIEVQRSTLFGRRIGAVADAAALRTLAALAGTGVANTFTARQSWSKGADIASAATLVIGTDGNFFDVTGSTGPITAMTVAAGTLFMLHFDSTPTLTHHATNLNLGISSITAAAGDRAAFFATGANQVELISYQKADGTALVAPAASSLPAGHIQGLVPANNGSDANNDIDISAGSARDAANTADMVLAAAITKRLDAGWAVGTNQGGLDTGSEANSTWYAVWLIKRSDTGVVDVLFSASFSAPTMPSNYDKKRLIGEIYNNSSGNIDAFRAVETPGGGIHYDWMVPILSVNAARTTTRTNYTLRVPPMVVQAHVANGAQDANGQFQWLSNPNLTDTAPDAAGTATAFHNSNNGVVVGGMMDIWVITNSSGQIALDASAASGSWYVRVWGWHDFRRA